MLTVHSPLPCRARCLGSRDPVEMKRVILPLYSGPVVFAVLSEVIIVVVLKFQVTEANGFSVGVSVVVNVTVPPTAAFRGPSGNTPAPLVKPGEDSYSLRSQIS